MLPRIPLHSAKLLNAIRSSGQIRIDTGFVRIKIRVSRAVEVDQLYSYIILLFRLLFVQISVYVTVLTKYVLFPLLWQNHFYSFVFVNDRVSSFSVQQIL